ncbi:MAG: GGDEF domain-containing protein [Acidimicrobiales bacterium]
MNEGTRVEVDCLALLERTRLAATPETGLACLADITMALESETAVIDRARLLICRARVRSLELRDGEACEDASAALTLAELAGDSELAIDAASLGAAHASRLGNASLASELATKSVLALDFVNDDRLRTEVTNRLGIFCYYYLDYERAVELFEISLAAAERAGERERVCRELYNLADASLLASQHSGYDIQRLERAEVMARRLVLEERALMTPRLGSYRLLAEVLCELGRVHDALKVLEGFRADANVETPWSQYAELGWVEARCLRLAGRVEEALAAALRDVRIVEAGGDEHDLMLTLEELAACEEAAGDLEKALADAREAKRHMWAIHQAQTRQLVEHVWARVDFERDRMKLQTRADEATRSAEEDALTGVGNRRRLERFLSEEAVRQGDVACIIADIDSFKEINDTFGHEVGDAVLRQIGQLFLSRTRPGQQAIRFGGDEFVVALAGVDLAGANGFAERIRNAICEVDWLTIASGLRVTVSLGVGCAPARDWQAALAAADGRLLAAKRQGRNTIVGASAGALSA